jgi:hypothetical protein
MPMAVEDPPKRFAVATQGVGPVVLVVEIRHHTR